MYAFRKIYTGNTSYYNWSSNSVIQYDSKNLYDDYYSNGLVINLPSDNHYNLQGDTWAIISYDTNDLLEPIDTTITSVSQLTVVYTCQTPDTTFSSYFDLTALDSESSYQWATYVGDIDIMSNNIKDQGVMGRWVKYIKPSDHDKFINQITDPQWAYWWGTEIGDVDIMKPKINDSMYAFYWGLNHTEDRSLMQQYVVEQPWIDYWTQLIGPMS